LDKICKMCKKLLPTSCFGIQKKGNKNYMNTYCKKCNSKRISKYASENRDKINARTKEYRHKIGVSKRYGSGGGRPNGVTLTEQEKIEKKRLARKQWKYSMKKAGKLSKHTIQLVYEDNIKKFGTLTCYLCLKPIEIQKEHLEHKNPLSKGGTNDYENLGIACGRCNCRKHNMTVEQYLEYLNKKGVNIN
jgi:hypothetical protein